MPDLSPDLIDETRELGASLIRKFTPPEYIPGCTVKDITDKDQYAVDNGWIECLVSRHNQQRCRWRGQVPNIQVNDVVDVMYFKSYRLFTVFGQGGVGAQTQNILHNYAGTVAPTVNEDSADGYSVGSHWVDVTNDNSYIAVDVTAGSAVWNQTNNSGVGIDAWTTFTPTVTQSGSVTVTVTLARYKLVDDLCTMQLNLAVTGSGTTTNAISIGNIPAAAQSANASVFIGTGGVFDTTAGVWYIGAVQAHAAGDFRFLSYDLANYFGITPDFGLANGDIIRLQASYEV